MGDREGTVECNQCSRQIGRFVDTIGLVKLHSYMRVYCSLKGFERKCREETDKPHRHDYLWEIAESFDGFFNGLITVISRDNRHKTINLCRPGTPTYDSLPPDRLFHAPPIVFGHFSIENTRKFHVRNDVYNKDLSLDDEREKNFK